MRILIEVHEIKRFRQLLKNYSDDDDARLTLTSELSIRLIEEILEKTKNEDEALELNLCDVNFT